MSATVPYRPDFTRRVEHVTRVMTQTQLGKVVGVGRSSVSRWKSGEDIPKDRHAALLLDVDYILAQFAQHYPADRFPGWFTSSNAFLNGARPQDVLTLEGPTRVIEALHAEAAGSFA